MSWWRARNGSKLESGRVVVYYRESIGREREHELSTHAGTGTTVKLLCHWHDWLTQ